MKTLICYSLGKVESNVSRSLHRELYGYKDVSNHGRYKYKRKGLVDKLSCSKIIDSVILTNHKNAPAFLKVLKKYRAKTYVFIGKMKE